MQYVSKWNPCTNLCKRSSTLISAKEANVTNFAEALPIEMCLTIFSKLDIKSLCSAALTCKLWNHIIEGSDHLWKNHCLTVCTVCHTDVNGDRGEGLSWKVTLVRNYWKACVKKQWLSGRFSHVQCADDLPDRSMCPLDAEGWGEIFEAELER